MKTFVKLFIFLLIPILSNANNIPKIGIIVPLEHQAMKEITQGFKSQLTKSYPHPVHLTIQNAQHDPSMMMAIINQFQLSKMDLVLPIGEQAYEMSLAKMPQQSIIGVAAYLPVGANKLYTSNVIDEIKVEKQLQFLHQALPKLNKLTLIHSADDKIFDDVKALKLAAHEYNIQVQDLMISQVSDLYAIAKSIEHDSQGIFILKDSLVVSGISTLSKEAQLRKIPLIASDDGSVANGAAFAVGVAERAIGEKAAIMAAQVLNGRKIGEIPTQTMEHYHVFLNPQQALEQGMHLEDLKKTAKAFDYPIQILS